MHDSLFRAQCRVSSTLWFRVRGFDCLHTMHVNPPTVHQRNNIARAFAMGKCVKLAHPAETTRAIKQGKVLYINCARSAIASVVNGQRPRMYSKHHVICRRARAILSMLRNWLRNKALFGDHNEYPNLWVENWADLLIDFQKALPTI